MLRHEEISAYLKPFENPAGSQQARERVQALSPETARLGLALLDHPRLHGRHGEQFQRLPQLCPLDSLSDAERLHLFAALFPPIAQYVEASWQSQRAMPYQVGYLRRAFRAPHHPEYTRNTRIYWLADLLETVIEYQYDLALLPFLAVDSFYHQEAAIGLLLTAVLDTPSASRAPVYENLLQIVHGTHPLIVPSRFAITALLASSDPSAWEQIERLLLAAQRQEGLRQVVLESIDFAHPHAFVRMLRLISQEKLSRFAAVGRAVGVWLGVLIDSVQTSEIDALVRETLENLEHREIREGRLRQATGQSFYLALWAEAFFDADRATEQAAALAHEPDVERRYAAVHLLDQVATFASARASRVFLYDPDLRVAIKATGLTSVGAPSPAERDEIFAALELLLKRLPVEQTLPSAIWEWNRIKAKPTDLAAKLIDQRADRPFAALVPYLGAMDAGTRGYLLRRLKNVLEERKSLLHSERDLALSLLGDPSKDVREVAFQILSLATINAEEAELLEPLLARKAPDLRRGVIRLLLSQPNADCLASIARLSNSSDALTKAAAEEILSHLEKTDQTLVSLDNGLGLFDPAQRTAHVAPRPLLNPKRTSTLGIHLLRSLDELTECHSQTTVIAKSWDGQDVSELFGNRRWFDPNLEHLLDPVWQQWWKAMSQEWSLDDRDLIRLLMAGTLKPDHVEAHPALPELETPPLPIALKFPEQVQCTLGYLVARSSSQPALGLFLDLLESYLFAHQEKGAEKTPPATYQRPPALRSLTGVLHAWRLRHAEIWDRATWSRFWLLLRWIDDGLPWDYREYPPIEVTAGAYQRGLATAADVYEQLLPRHLSRGYLWSDLKVLTRRKPHPLLLACPELVELVRTCRDRIIEVELARGDLPTAASTVALCLASVFGTDLLLRLLTLLEKDSLSRGYHMGNESKSVVWSHLLRICLPTETDTPLAFAAAAARAAVPRKKLIDLALYAPQWAAHVECATAIPGLEDAAYWLHAHTKDRQWSADPEIRELWFTAVSERTPLSRQELLDGAVDVEWFGRVHRVIPPSQWQPILDSAKYAAAGNGHKRAELFAETIAEEVTAATLTARIQDKRHPDAVRALGLAPLPPAEPERRQELLRRYEHLESFLRQSKAYGALRQSSESLAHQIGLTNLARTAGYADPQRLSWAMEALAIADLKSGPVEVVAGECKAVLAINTAGEPLLTFEKAGKPLKDLPSALKKSPEMANLRARKTHLAQQTARMRHSLEAAMIRGDRFTYAELQELADHPLLRPMVTALMFTSPQGEVRWFADLSPSGDYFRLSHPWDLWNSGDWPARQRECLQAERLQPLKQAFRELYLLTETERRAPRYSGRYEGHQVNPQQALALFGQRGWVNVPEEGLRRTFHSDDVSVFVTFLEGWFTPADIDGLTLRHVIFRRRSDGTIIPLDQVNPRIFSEAMRDLDLVVSVAHRGGVDPETTASTVEMRTALLRETLALLRIDNVRLEDRYAFIDGQLGRYNVHLGSGTVHRQPGQIVCILPVHSQHRGRLFLPFADPDPKTAEVVSKVLLLAQDDKIKDPTILEQMRPMP